VKWSFSTLGDWLARWLPATPSAVPNAGLWSQVNYADELAAAGKYKEAVSVYASIIRAYPDDPLAYINCGSLFIDCGEYESAVGILRAAVGIAPQNTHLWANLSAALSDLGQHEAALEAANNAVAHDANNAKAYYNRAECWAAVNQPMMAIRDLETATTIDPEDKEIAHKLWLHRLAMAPPLAQYADAQYEPHAHGYELVDGIEVRATLQCPHCGSHFPSIKGSRIERTWCSHCGDITCGKLECRECVPFKKKLELIATRNSQSTG